MTDKELIKKMAEFMMVFEYVFDEDWEYSKDAMKFLGDREMNSFLNSETPDDELRWKSREQLVSLYRNIVKQLMIRDSYLGSWRDRQDHDFDPSF